MRWTGKRVAAVVTAALLGTLAGVVGVTPPVGAGSGSRNSITYELQWLINYERGAHGLGPLPPADLGAQAWANHLGATGAMAHAPLTVDAENLASASRAHTTGDMVVMWMNSDGHRTNMLNPNATLMDVGISCAGGRMVAVARFRNAWAIPTVGASGVAVGPGSGASCAGLGLASAL
jgi:hypothetical protein